MLHLHPKVQLRLGDLHSIGDSAVLLEQVLGVVGIINRLTGSRLPLQLFHTDVQACGDLIPFDLFFYGKRRPKGALGFIRHNIRSSHSFFFGFGGPR